MGTGYTRNDTGNNIADGNVINASDLDGEFDAIQSAFNASAGHSHDGTTGEGPQIEGAGIADNAVALGTKTTGNYVATVAAGTGISISGSGVETAAVTVSGTNASTTAKGIAQFNATDFSVSAGVVTLNKDPSITLTGNVTGTGTMSNLGSVSFATTIADNSVALGTKTTGNYVATIATGAGLDGSSSAEGGTPTISLNLNELDTSTSNGDGDFFVVLDSAGTQRKLTKGNVNISGFNNDSGFTTNVGDITNVSVSNGLSGGGASGDVSISLDSDLRGHVTQFGQDTNDFISVGTTTIDFQLDGNLDMRLENDGDLHVDGDVIAFSTTTSDPRLKDNIQPVEGALDKVAKLTGYTFNYKVDGRESAGVMSTEVREVLPSAVRETTLPLKSPNGEDDTTEYDVVQYDQLHALLIEAVKELTKRVEKLEAK